MEEIKTIAVICNYEIKPKRIGGMDRFFKAYNQTLIEEGKKAFWFFSGGENFNFYEGFNLHLATDGNVENEYLNYVKKNEPFDAVVTHFVALCTPFYKKLRQTGVGKIIAVDHNPRPLNGFPWQKRLKNKIKGLLYAGYIDCFVGVSNYTAEEIAKDYGRSLASRTVVVYNGVDTSIYLKRTEVNLGKFIVASHLRNSKGIQDLIEAVHLLPSKIKEMIRVDVFGEGPLENELKNKIQQYNLQEIIQLKGSSPNLPIQFKNYSFLLQPTYMECFSLSILESLASNVPVITTPVGGNLEIIANGENGFVFETGNIVYLKNLIWQVVTQKISIQKITNLEIEEKFNLNQMVKNHINLLECT